MISSEIKNELKRHYLFKIFQGLVGLELSVKSSYSLSSCPNLRLGLHRGILITNVRHFGIISSFVKNQCNTI